jgi:hypothetical protein
MWKKFNLISVFFAFLASFFRASFAHAQDFGLQPVDEVIMLANGDPRVIIGRIISIVLTFLGVIALLLIIYAGFLWMTSGGEEEKIRRAKNVLKNAAIGLLIIFSSWALTNFLINRLHLASLGGDEGGTQVTSPPSVFGLAAIGACSIESVYPESNQKDVPRNTSIIATFKEAVDVNDLCVNASGATCACDNANCNLINPAIIHIYQSDLGDACANSCPAPSSNTNLTNVMMAVSSDHRILLMTPVNYLGSENPVTRYNVKLTSDLRKTNGDSMFKTCSVNELLWGFEISTSLDLIPPQVLSSSLFPYPDNAQDVSSITTSAARATAEILVNDCPNAYSPAELISVTPSTEVSLNNYHGTINYFRVSVPESLPNRAQLFNGNTNTLLGIADFDVQGIVTFPGFLSLRAADHPVGSLWEIRINPEQLADNLTVGNTVYVFSETGENNNIITSLGSCNTNTQAANIVAKLSGHPDIDVIRVGTRITLTAKAFGVSGNDIDLSTSNPSALTLTPFSGGVDQIMNHIIRDKADAPMNSIIKISFNEPMNPIALSGTADEVAGYIRVMNANSNSRPNGAACSSNSDCLSYRCEGSTCAGDYVRGNFMVSSNYQTVEFIADNECGLNGCGDRVYCLPPNSNLAVQIRAANLRTCNTDQDCMPYNPYSSCNLGPLNYRTCQDTLQRNHPAANPLNLAGLVDMAFNSLDGNRDSATAGPLSFFNENLNNPDEGDSFRFSFFVNDQKDLSAPIITSILPAHNQTNLGPQEPVEITFNSVMMANTLRSGSKKFFDGSQLIEHKFINLRSPQPSPIGFWIESEDRDSDPLDGVNDITVARIKHSSFSEALTYFASVGSGVKNIYQNCFKPSSGPGCEASFDNPSCCFGVPTANLNEQGNCP